MTTHHITLDKTACGKSILDVVGENGSITRAWPQVDCHECLASTFGAVTSGPEGQVFEWDCTPGEIIPSDHAVVMERLSNIEARLDRLEGGE